ncbi:flagellar protein FliT [Peribacillus sp. JNUCC 23]|uniref:flagellar protein FliT n=1 Tax=Peribacillus sp. NPDC096379 TaxID=3364393 RepID=UPI0007822724
MSLQKFSDITVELLDVLTNRTTDERSDRINRIVELLDLREVLLQSIQPPFSEEEQVLGRQVVELNYKVDEWLLLQKKDIQRDIKQLNEKKQTSNKYTNPYDKLSIDGVFYDKKN